MADELEHPEPLRQRLSVRQLDAQIQRLDALPTLPAVAARLQELLADFAAVDRQAEIAVACDAPLVARLLREAGRFRPEVRSIRQALDVLGPEAAIAAVLSMPLERVEAAGKSLYLEPFWLHCLATACAAQMLAERLESQVDPQEAYLCGLLHDLGKLALERCFPKSHARALSEAQTLQDDLAQNERRVLGVDHCQAGRRLAEHWRLAKSIQQSIWLHHHPPEALPQDLDSRVMPPLVGLADAIARRQQIGFSGNCAPPVPVTDLARSLGLSERDICAVSDALGQAVAQRAALAGMGQACGADVSRRALAQAHARLGRLNDQLRSQRRELARGAQAFRCIEDLSAGLDSQSTVADALALIALAVAKLQPVPARPVAAYSIDEQSREALAVRCQGDEPAAWRTLCLARPLPQQFLAGPARQAASAMLSQPDELLDWIDLDGCTHLPLTCAGKWVGGVFLQPPEQDKPQQGDLLQALAAAMGPALAIVQGRCSAMVLSEQLAQASGVLAATQQALAEARTLAGIVELAAGAAHELNNPLAIISGRAQLMRDKAVDEQDRKTWQLIVDQAHRISDIITELMEFASPPPPRPQAVEAGKLLNEAAEAFSSSDHPQAAAARVDIEVVEGVLPAWADPDQVRGVLVELMTNAATAATEQARIHLSAAPAGEQVLLSVRDEGPGMDQATAAAAFTPFFSSQRAGRRRGLGLPRAKRYVEMNGGQIWIRSAPGKGTTVNVRLPAAESPAQAEETP